MQPKSELPPGQRELAEMPRFGLPKYASRFPAETERVAVVVCGDVEHTVEISDRMSELRRVEQVSDFHCVTSWTKRAVGWTGYRFSDFYEQLVGPAAKPDSQAGFVIFRCQDGYRASLPLRITATRTQNTLNRSSSGVTSGTIDRPALPSWIIRAAVLHTKSVAGFFLAGCCAICTGRS